MQSVRGLKHTCQVAMLLALLLTVFTGVGRSDAENSPKDPSADAEQGYISILYPIKSATLSSEVMGVIHKINFDMGAAFKKGAVLMLIDDGYFLSEKDKAEASKAFAAAAYQSKRELYNQKSISTHELAKAQSDYQIAMANFDIAQKRLAACTIRAPFDGKIAKRLTNENEFVAEGQPLLEIIDDRMIRAKFHLPASIYAQIEVGQCFDVRIRDVSRTFKGIVTHISPVVESNTSSFQVFAEIDNDRNSIRSGMTAYVMPVPVESK